MWNAQCCDVCSDLLTHVSLHLGTNSFCKILPSLTGGKFCFFVAFTDFIFYFRLFIPDLRAGDETEVQSPSDRLPPGISQLILSRSKVKDKPKQTGLFVSDDEGLHLQRTEHLQQTLQPNKQIAHSCREAAGTTAQSLLILRLRGNKQGNR